MKVKTSVSLSRRAHRNAKKAAKLQKRSVSSFLELWLEQTFGNGIGAEVRIVPARAEVQAEP